MIIRREEARDRESVYAVNAAAFETEAEARLADALRERATPVISLVAEEAGVVVGHLLLSPVTLSEHPALKLMGLAPMAVAPGRQRSGIGSRLVEHGLRACAEDGFGAVFVLGHPDYYPRFGFTPASRFGIGCAYDVPDEVFMAIELIPGYLAEAEGIVRYHDAFADV